MRTPWGIAQTAEQVAPGITEVTTAGHGGIKLSPILNALVPEFMRIEDGWYEEDVNWAIVATVFPLAFGTRAREGAKRTLRMYLPQAYARVYGIE